MSCSGLPSFTPPGPASAPASAGSPRLALPPLGARLRAGGGIGPRHLRRTRARLPGTRGAERERLARHRVVAGNGPGAAGRTALPGRTRPRAPGQDPADQRRVGRRVAGARLGGLPAPAAPGPPAAVAAKLLRGLAGLIALG